jgi:outer membrane protein TolC
MIYAKFMAQLAVIASLIEQFATEIRHLQKTEVREVEEGFATGQKGSSAMPHKKNPVLCENLCGLSRVVRSNMITAFENINLWHERDISHSSAERIIFPDSLILVDFMLARFKYVVENLVMQISSQYYLIISLQNQVNLLNELVSISQIRYNQALTRYNIGSDSGLEYKQAKIYLNSDSSSLLLQKENLKNAYIELFRLMNLPLHSSHSINDSIIPEPQMDVNNLILSVTENNTTLKGIKAGERIAKLDTKITKATRYPLIDFTSGYNFNLNQSQYFPSKYNDSKGFNWGFSLSVPIFDGNEINRKIKNARINEENAALSYLKAKQDLESELYQLYNVYSNNLRMIEFEEESRESAFLNLEAAMEKYKLGSLSGIEFRDIQLSYMNASDRRLRAIYQAKVSEISLHLMAGELFRPR